MDIVEGGRRAVGETETEAEAEVPGEGDRDGDGDGMNIAGTAHAHVRSAPELTAPVVSARSRLDASGD